jgi:hypothetical protein
MKTVAKVVKRRITAPIIGTVSCFRLENEAQRSAFVRTARRCRDVILYVRNVNTEGGHPSYPVFELLRKGHSRCEKKQGITSLCN